MRSVLASAGLAILGVLACAGVSNSQTANPREPARVLVLGTFHFANPGLDAVKSEVGDMLSAENQAEINAVIKALSRFRPTKIAVEQLPASAPTLDSLYSAYRSGEHELSANEVEQLGFRLAAMFGLPRVYPVDHKGEFPFGPVMEYAQTHDTGMAACIREELARRAAEASRQHAANTVGEILRMGNDPENLLSDHGAYVSLAQVGAGDGYPGANLLARWYERNIRIFANLQRITKPGDRVLVIIGTGHVPILSELIRYDPGMELVDALGYLTPE